MPEAWRSASPLRGKGSHQPVFALSTPPGRSAIAVMRVSGKDVGADLLRPLSQGGILSETAAPVQPRRASVRQVHRPSDGAAVDHAVIVWFPAPASYTGEDVVELHIHGGLATRKAVEAVLSEGMGYAPAPPGEFTRRAMANGRMDVTAVEGLADLLLADTEAQRAQAMAVAGGQLSGAVSRWRSLLIRACGRLEATIDFGEDEFIPPATMSAVRRDVSMVAGDLQAALSRSHHAEVVRDGFHVAIVGPPNAGKSSLMNALARRPVAIVSDVPGTTRDVLTVSLDVRGLPIVVHDTAGLRPAAGDAVEAIGMARALDAASRCRLLLVLVDVCDAAAAGHVSSSLASVLASPTPPAVMLVMNKTDTVAGQGGDQERVVAAAAAAVQAHLPRPVMAVHAISCASGEGLDALLAGVHHSAMASLAAEEGGTPASHSHAEPDAVASVPATPSLDGGGDRPMFTRLRHRHHATAALAHLHQAVALDDTQIDLVSEEVRAAVSQLECLIGVVGVDDVLDALFQEFCIGK